MKPWDQFSLELMTDLYELTMAATYLAEGMSGEATFSLYVRDYPAHRAYFVSAGLEHLLELIPDFRFTDQSIDYLASLGKFTPQFLDYLKEFRFSGTIRAIPEGRIFFAQEPMIEISGPIIEAQILETLVINVIQLETLIASKAARCVQAARGRSLIDFSMRRTHGIEASLKVARASYLAGFSGTSNLLAGKLYGIPVYGTMAHSFITSFEREVESFLSYARVFPESTILLIDTYDTLCGAEKALQVARRMREEGRRPLAVRLDSGDMVALSKEVKGMFREAGFPDIGIIASGSLDEFRLEEMLESGAEIDVFALGTRVGVSSDAPYLDIAYKLVEYSGRPVLKLSTGKRTWVGKKQVFRRYDAGGMMQEDVITLLSDRQTRGRALMETVMEKGKRVRPMESLDAIRSRFQEEWETLPSSQKRITAPDPYPVNTSASLQELEGKVVEQTTYEEVELACPQLRGAHGRQAENA
jgi:nicotinate phosphoribosyltransferase